MDTAANTHPPAWNPHEDWKDIKVPWIKVDVSKEDLKRFGERSNTKAWIQSLGFLAVIAASGTLAFWAFTAQQWILLALALYLHGTLYTFFGDAIHELSHNTVFKSKRINQFVTAVYGWLAWAWNPHFYRLSHQTYHHRYTLYQGSDGEDVPNYFAFTPQLLWESVIKCIHPKAFLESLGRLIKGVPTSNGWRPSGYALDNWESFILQKASPAERKRIIGFGKFCLWSHLLFVIICVTAGIILNNGLWFLPVLITLTPLYGASFPHVIVATHQHAGQDANEPDFRKSCGSVKLDPILSFLYWRMEYHTEHHMFASIPCYNLKAFSNHIADQMPPREPAIPRLFKLHKQCKEKYGTWQQWRDQYGRFKGF